MTLCLDEGLAKGFGMERSPTSYKLRLVLEELS